MTGYELRCPFCKRMHRSPFIDELEEEILACRDQAPAHLRGRLEDYEDPQLRPIRPETAACADGYV